MLSTYKNKKILVTGHTGFKGSWLSTWLLSLGAEVYGISNGLVSTPPNFEASNLSEKIHDLRLDLLDLNNLFNKIGII